MTAVDTIDRNAVWNITLDVERHASDTLRDKGEISNAFACVHSNQ